MAAQQTPPSGARVPATALERAFERKVRLGKWALLFEHLWPRAWLVLGLAGLFVGASLAGLWPRLPELTHKIVLALFGLAFAIALLALMRVRWPSREQAIRRVESVSGIKHRPASSYEDTLTLGASDARTAALWRVHRQRLAALLQKMRVGHPSPRTDRYDPFALRALLLLSVFVLLVVVGDSASDRLRSAFRFGALAKGAEARIDAWVTPPAYTGKPPIMLADGGFSGLRPPEKPVGPMEIPDRSVLVVRGSGAALGALSLEAPGIDGTAQRLEAPAPAGADDVTELKLEVRKSGTVSVYGGGTPLLSWPFVVTPDNPPKIALTKEPERTPRGALKLNFKVEDDYGVVSAEGRIRRIRPKEDKSSTAWARAGAKKGARPPYERPPALALRLPRAYPKQAEGQSFHEIGDHLWAGMKVELTLVAKDLAGQSGRSEPREIVLPERRFTKPLARAVVEQRRRLAEDPRDRLQVARALDALTLEPEDFIEDLQVYLGLRSAYWRLQREATRSARNSVSAQLWNIALRIEDGNLTDAERALRAAQERLSKALGGRRLGRGDPEAHAGAASGPGAVPGAALQAGAEPAADAGHGPQQSVHDAPGHRADAQEPGEHGALGQQGYGAADAQPAARPARPPAVRTHGRPGPEPALRPDDGRVRQPARQAAAVARRHLRTAAPPGRARTARSRPARAAGSARSARPAGPGSAGRRPGPGSGRGRSDGRARRPPARAARYARPVARGLREFGLQAPGQLGGAGEAMERAERALREGDLDGASQEEARALEQLRQGAREMAQQMLRQMPSRYGMNNSQGELDPMGRPPQRTDGPDPGVGVKVPDQIDIQRAREILEELRRRLGEPTRQPQELEYLERLLKRF